MPIVEKVEFFEVSEDSNRDKTFRSLLSTGCRIRSSSGSGQVEVDVDQTRETIALIVSWTPSTKAVEENGTHLDFRGNRYQISRKIRTSNLEIVFEALRKI